MSKDRPLISRSVGEWLSVLVVCALIAGCASYFGWLWRIDQVIYDGAMSMSTHHADEDVVVVAIDDTSIARIGRWPWPRTVHAELLNRLREAGSGPVAVDVLFSEPALDDHTGDEALADAIRAHGRVALPVIQASVASGIVTEAPPAPIFAGVAAAIGHIHVEFDPDGIARSVYLWEGLGQARHRQLGLALLGLVDPVAAARYGPAPTERGAGWVRSSWLRIPFVGAPGSFTYISYVDLLAGRVPAEAVRNKIVLIGATAAGMGDIVPTPTSGFSRPMPGVEVHANVFSALRRGVAVHNLSPLPVALGAMVVVSLLMLAVLRLPPRYSLAVAFVSSICVLGLSWGLLYFAYLWVPPAGAILGCMLAYPLWSWRRLEAAHRYLDEELEALRKESSRWNLPELDSGYAGNSVDPLETRINLVRVAAVRQRQLRRFIVDTLENLPVGALVLGMSGKVLLHNRRATALLGADGAEAVGSTIEALAWPPEIAIKNGVPQPPPDGKPLSVELESPSGPYLLVSVAGLYDQRGRQSGVVLGIDDITAMHDVQVRREETMHYLSHDLRAPLSSIITMVEGAHAFDTPLPEHEQMLNRVGRYARSALDLADNPLRLVRAESVDARQFIELDLALVAQEAVDEAWALARARSITIEVIPELGEEVEYLVRGDRNLVRRAVLNLLTNAVKFSPEGSQVEVFIRRGRGGWELAVRDHGVGIDAEHLPQLFRRFGRLPQKGVRRVSGVGLGLMIVKTVTERHGGTVAVESEAGVGSTFIIRLPLAETPVHDRKAA
ncbi:MAG: CHASE2 domain-containing protein [Rhodocyclaceae bacterium]|nr:CHASE2 domain-containing protein [Rhodocyclaceae bacterium]